ncbi:MAG: transglutaminase family protein [Acidobacteriota bacterium]|nr:transglutaminase family protein [Acidobacteriota bacterium]
MNRYHLVHITEFHYDGPVSESYNEVRLRPLTDEKQSCLSFKLTTTPPSQSRSYQDAFGNWVHLFNVLREHRHLKIETDSVILRMDAPAEPPSATLADVDAAHDELFEDYYDYLVPSDYVPHLAQLDPLIAAAEALANGNAYGFAEAAARLIHERFQYLPGATHVHSSLADSLTNGAGVCQDFAHLLIGMARKRGIPARYVSGYLVPQCASNPDSALEEVIGGQASHAWAEVYIPGSGWLPLDPTLGRPVAARHVRIGYGRDYGDVAPVRGMYNGHAGQRLSVDVQLRPDVDVDGHEQLNSSTLIPPEEEILEERPAQPVQQQQQ